MPARVQVADAVWARHYYGFSGKQAQAIFSTGLMVFAVIMIFAGRWQDRVGPRIVACTGGLVLASGYAIAAFAGPSFAAVLFSIGVVGRGHRHGLRLSYFGLRQMVSRPEGLGYRIGCSRLWRRSVLVHSPRRQLGRPALDRKEFQERS